MLAMVASAVGFLASCADLLSQGSSEEAYVPLIDTILCAAGYWAARAAWRWRRVGIQGLFVLGPLGALIGSDYGDGSLGRAGAVVASLVSLGLWWTFVVRHYWPLFGNGAPTDDEDDEYIDDDEQECPECGTVSANSGVRCDCGYSFVREQMERECPHCGRFNSLRTKKCACNRWLRRAPGPRSQRVKSHGPRRSG